MSFASIKTVFLLAFRNLFRNPRRTVAILLTLASGTTALFLFSGFNNGIMNQYRANVIKSRFGHGQINTLGYRDQVFEKPWEHWIEQPEEVLTQLKSIPEITHVFPRLEFYALLTNGETTLSGLGQGIDGKSEKEFFTTLNVEEGDHLGDNPEGILLGKGLAASLRAKPGDRITVLANTLRGSINGADLVVTGIFHTGAKEFDDRVFRLPIKVAQQLLDTPKIESIALGLRDLKDWEGVSKETSKRFPQLEATPFAVLDKVYYQNAVDWLKSQFSVIRAIILLIVILGIFNTISTSIFERKQEVGYLRANGESRWDVMVLFLAEGIVLGIAGALLGIAIALFLNFTVLANGILMPPSPGLTRQYHVLIELEASAAVFTFLLTLVCALFGTLLASLRVALLPIGKALRSL